MFAVNAHFDALFRIGLGSTQLVDKTLFGLKILLNIALETSENGY